MQVMIDAQNKREELQHGVIVSCGMEVAYNNYLMFAASQDSLIIDRFVAYSWQKLSLLTVTK